MTRKAHTTGIQTKLVKLSICPCGHTVLHDEIPLGTIYTIHPQTIREGFAFYCGGCGTVHRNIQAVLTDSRIDDTLAAQPLPLAIFDYKEKSGRKAAK